MQLTLTAEEVVALKDVCRFASDSDQRLSILCASVQERKMTWFATDNQRLAVFEGGNADFLSGAIAVPKRDFLVAAEICRVQKSDSLKIVSNAGNNLTILLPGIHIFARGRAEAVLNIAGAANKFKFPDMQIRVQTADLAAAVYAVATGPSWLPRDARKRFSLRVDAAQGTLEAIAEWEGYPDTRAAATCQAGSSAVIAVDPSTLLDVVEVARTSEISLQHDSSADGPVWMLLSEKLMVLAMPYQSALDAVRPQFEELLAQTLGIDIADIRPDKDGDYPIELANGERGYIHLEKGDELQGTVSRVRLYTSIVRNVEENFDALHEINLQNQSLRYTRLYLSDGVVFLEADITLEGISRPQLQGAIDAFTYVANEVGPLMQVFFGAAAPPRDERNS